MGVLHEGTTRLGPSTVASGLAPRSVIIAG